MRTSCRRDDNNIMIRGPPFFDTLTKSAVRLFQFTVTEVSSICTILWFLKYQTTIYLRAMTQVWRLYYVQEGVGRVYPRAQLLHIPPTRNPRVWGIVHIWLVSVLQFSGTNQTLGYWKFLTNWRRQDFVEDNTLVPKYSLAPHTKAHIDTIFINFIWRQTK